MEFLPKSSGQEFHGLVDHIISKNRADNTKFNTNLTVQAVCSAIRGRGIQKEVQRNKEHVG